MWNIRLLFQRTKGFTLLEIILVISVSLILLTSLFSLLSYTRNIATFGELEDEILLNGSFGLEFIKEEISSSERIISPDKIKNMNKTYENHIGFVIMNHEVINKTDNYTFITYYLNSKNEIVRIAINKGTKTYPSIEQLKGYNVICSYVLSIDKTNIDFENKILNLNLTMGKDKKSVREFKSTIFLRTIVDF